MCTFLECMNEFICKCDDNVISMVVWVLDFLRFCFLRYSVWNFGHSWFIGRNDIRSQILLFGLVFPVGQHVRGQRHFEIFCVHLLIEGSSLSSCLLFQGDFIFNSSKCPFVSCKSSFVVYPFMSIYFSRSPHLCDIQYCI